MNKLSVIIITKDEAEMLPDCLKSVSFADEIILIDEDSTDETTEIAKDYGTKVISTKDKRFDEKRNLGMKAAKFDWIFYIDADERVSGNLRNEVSKLLKTPTASTYIVKRDNYFLGVKMYQDKVERLFLKKTLKGWTGEVHESPQYEGKVGQLNFPLTHFTHRNITSMLEKTNKWSQVEANLRFKSGHPPVKSWRLIRIAITEFINQFVKKRIFIYGTAGWIEGIFQVIDKLIIYVKLWELQQKKS